MLSDQEISLLDFLSNIKTWKGCLRCTSYNVYSNLIILTSGEGKVEKGRLLFLRWRNWLIPWFPSYQLGQQWACCRVENHPLSNTFSLNCARLSQKVWIEILPPLNLMGIFPLASAEPRFSSHVWIGHLPERRMFSCELSALTSSLSAVGTQPCFKLNELSESLESVKAHLTRHDSCEVLSLLEIGNTGPIRCTIRFLFQM